ncbi:Hypothetical protein KVN_LOCUS128 [uncultured virus]|nr:Hypothetical protein KVN_LOCUS128 [uncultured virus]
MKKILMISFYDPIEYLKSIKEILLDHHFFVKNYPLFKYAYDKYDKMDNYQEHLNNYIKSNNINIVFWIFLGVPIDVFKYIKEKNPDIYFVMINNDDPMNFNNNIQEISNIFDLIVVPSKENLDKYKSKQIIYYPFGYDEKSFFPNNEDNYICDISIICTDIYHPKFYPNQFINKKDILEKLINFAKTKNKIFNIYGPGNIKEHYNKNYKSFLKYDDMCEVFNKSKINIFTHQDCSKNLFISDTVFKIIGCGGLLLVDKQKNINEIFTDKINCIFLDEKNYLNQIDEILTNYEKYNIIKQNGFNLSKKYTLELWLQKIIISICKNFFSEQIYQELYCLNKNLNLWQYWLEIGIKNKQVCVDFDVPNYFKYEEYALHKKFDNYSKKKLWFHWNKNSRDKKFIEGYQKKFYDNSSFDKINLSNDQWFKINNIFEKISNNDNIQINLQKLKNIYEVNPGCEINKCLDIYINLSNKRIDE